MIAIVGQLAYKVFEIKVRKIHFLSNIWNRADAKLHQWLNIANIKYNRYKNILNIFIFDFVPAYLYEQLIWMKDYVSKKYYQMGDDFRGRRILKSTGSVSFFLEKLSEDKPTR